MSLDIAIDCSRHFIRVDLVPFTAGITAHELHNWLSSGPFADPHETITTTDRADDPMTLAAFARVCLAGLRLVMTSPASGMGLTADDGAAIKSGTGSTLFAEAIRTAYPGFGWL